MTKKQLIMKKAGKRLDKWLNKNNLVLSDLRDYSKEVEGLQDENHSLGYQLGYDDGKLD